MSKRVLIISHLFPPDAGGGVYRILKFCKFLPRFSWQPLVLTTKGGYYRERDESLLQEILPDVEVKRTFSLEPGHRSLQLSAASRGAQPATGAKWIRLRNSFIWNIVNLLNKWFFIPDKSIGWVFFAELAGGWLIRKKKIDLIFVTGNPFSSFLIAHQLKRWSGVPYVLDFRDSWTLAPYGEKPSILKRKIAQTLEKRLLKEASAAIMATEPMRHDYLEKYPNLKDKFYTITNGFDEDDLKGVEPIKHKKFTIIHVGSLNLTFRRPEFFLQAFKKVIEEDDKKNIQAIFVGKVDSALKSLIESLSLSEEVKLIDFVPHQQCLNYMAGADVLLLICGYNRQEQTGKVFEYMLMGKPILALVHPDGAAGEVVRQSHPGSVICSPQEVEHIAAAIKTFYQKWSRKELKAEGSDSRRQQFSRFELTRKLVNVFNKVLE